MKGIGRRTGRSVLAVSVAVGLALQAGCDSVPTAPVEDAVPTVMTVLATAGARASSVDGTQPWEERCPGGGRMVIEGTSSFTPDAAGLLVHRWDQVLRYDGCVLLVGEREVRADGVMQLAGEARYGPPVDRVRPAVSQHATQTGWLTTVTGGQSSTCAYDLSIDLVPGTNMYHIQGQVCGRPVDDRARVRP
ncbi:MAG: hypothetical protein PVI57_17525 [Gemmatimonadota bacterium]